MAWHHVENVDGYDTEPRTYTDGSTHSRVHGFSIWRCGNCRALAIGGEGAQASGPCMNCKSGMPEKKK